MYFILIIIIAISLLYFFNHKKTREIVDNTFDYFYEKYVGVVSNKSLALVKAKAVFDEAISEGRDLSSGPCLAEQILIDWSVDIVHVPRQESDDLLENMCKNYITGKTRRLIEMDEWGNIVNIK